MDVIKPRLVTRVLLFVGTNLAVMLVLSVVLSVLGVGNRLAGAGLDVGGLLVFSLVVGFTGALVSLLISKPMAKWSTGARVISSGGTPAEQWLVGAVERLATRAGIRTPEVAVYQGEPNAFATGAFRNSALVAVSTGLLETLEREEVEAVLGHEVAHIANGDMVTMSLVQGVLNTFVVFLSRVVGYFVDRVLLRGDEERGPGIGYMVTVLACQVVFGLLASLIVAWFSRRREFRADAGSARFLGASRPMERALARLGGLTPGALPQSVAAFGIAGGRSWSALWSTHPPFEARIAALRNPPATR